MKIFSRNTWGVDVNNAWRSLLKRHLSKKIRVMSLDFEIYFALLEVRNLCMTSRLLVYFILPLVTKRLKFASLKITTYTVLLSLLVRFMVFQRYFSNIYLLGVTIGSMLPIRDFPFHCSNENILLWTRPSVAFKLHVHDLLFDNLFSSSVQLKCCLLDLKQR